MSWLEVLGWFGTTLYLLNYAYLAFYPKWKRVIYFAANGIAAISLVVSSAALASWQAVGINGFWAAISIWLLLGLGFDWVPLTRRSLEFGVLGLLLVAAGSVYWDWRLSVSWVGWSSTFAFSLAYLLFAAQKLQVRRYHFWNAYAAFVLLPQLWLDTNWPVFAMEVAWFGISVAALIKTYRLEQSETAEH